MASPSNGSARRAMPSDEERPLIDHFVELATRLRRILIAVIVAAAVLSFIPADRESYVPLISYFPKAILTHVLPQEITWRGHTYTIHIAQYNPFGGFNLLLKSALLLGLLGASPVIAYEIYSYVKPALYPHELRLFRRVGVVAIALFLLGVLTAFEVVLPIAFKFMIITSIAVSGPNTLVAFADIEKLFTTIILIALATGIAFEAPIIVFFLVYIGIIDKSWFEGENRKWVLLVSMILGAAISPDPSGIGMLVIGTMMYISIMISYKLADRLRSQTREEQEQPAGEEIAVPTLQG
ncbi:MAG: twin-arginine translocase subunit TatC [Desulfurococcales archaeon]|nr:twin-arginine translocase subunit TatC [Desulfurococcales archaeon]